MVDIEGVDIKEVWQLQAMTGNLIYYKNFDLRLTDANGASLEHYAAWSGSIEALDWLTNNPYILLAQGKRKDEIVTHYWSREAIYNWLSSEYTNLDSNNLGQKQNKPVVYYRPDQEVSIPVWMVGNKNILASVRNRDKEGLTCVHAAAAVDNVHILEWFRENNPACLIATDNFGQTIAHYAVCSHGTKVLNWIIKNIPELLNTKTNDANTSGATPIHYAAIKGNDSLKDFQTLFDYDPRLLNTSTKHGENAVHIAASTGNIELLEWFKQNKPNDLLQRDKSGSTVFHYAAQSGNKEVLKWVSENIKELRDTPCKKGYKFTNDALMAKENNIEQFNYALSLTPNRFKFKVISSKELPALELALKTNYTLLSVTLPPLYEPTLAVNINKQINRNKKLVQELISFLQGIDQSGCSPVAKLSKSALFMIFKQQVPAAICEEQTRILFNYVYDKVCAIKKKPFKWMSSKETKANQSEFKSYALKLIKKEKDRLKPYCTESKTKKSSSFLVNIGFMKPANNKLNALKNLQGIIEKNADKPLANIKALVGNWYAKNKETIEEQRNHLACWSSKPAMQTFFEQLYHANKKVKFKLDEPKKKDSSKNLSPSK